MSHNDTLIAALDVGTTKVACFIARVDEAGELDIIGVGYQLSQGIRSGVITDIKAAETSIVSAVHAAEKMAGVTLDQVAVSLSGGALKSHNVHVEVPLGTQGISQRDIARVMEHGKHTLTSEERTVLHCIPISYSIDEARGIQDPNGMYGHRFGADLHVVTASASAVKNLLHCVTRCQLDVIDCVASSYASGLACLLEDEMDLGVTLIDIGGGSTSVAVFVEGKILYTDLIPYGGTHVTSDIAKGLSTSLAGAERIKALYGGVSVAPSEEREAIDVPQIGSEMDVEEGAPITRSMLVGIIRPRIEEIFEIIRGRLEDSKLDKVAGRRVVITGGSSQLAGMRDLATRVFNKQIRIARPHEVRGLLDSTSGGGFATALGMLEYMRQQVVDGELSLSPRPFVFRQSFMKAVRWVREVF